MTIQTARQFAVTAVVIACFAIGSAFSKGKEGVPSFGRSVHIAAGETVDEDVVCFGCSVTVDGTLDGDTVTFGGRIRVGDNGHITGDAVAVGGSVYLGERAEVGGDSVAVGGRLERAPSAVVHGEAVSTPF